MGVSITQFRITQGEYGFYNLASHHDNYFDYRDTVAAWGKLRHNTKENNVTDWMDVLVVKRNVKLIDSIYLGANKAPNNWCAAFLWLPYDTSWYSELYFYRRGETVPLIYIRYNESRDYERKSIMLFTVHSMRLPMDTTTTAIYFPESFKEEPANFTVYPNPMRGNKFFIHCNKSALLNTPYKIFRLNGAVLKEAIMRDETTEVMLENVASGVYAVWMNGETKLLVVQ